MKSTFTKQFTTKFQLFSVIFKKWIGFCLINASSVSHIFFLVSAEFFCKGNSWLSSWGWAFIWDNNNSQAREKLIVSWRKSGNFKISYVNSNVIVGSDSNTGYYSFSVNSCIGNIFTSIFSKAYVLSCFRYSLDLLEPWSKEYPLFWIFPPMPWLKDFKIYNFVYSICSWTHFYPLFNSWTFFNIRNTRVYCPSHPQVLQKEDK